MKGKHLKYIKRICDNCPCLNNDYESGCSCNLGFNTELIWVSLKDNTQEVADDKDMRSHLDDFDMINASDDCELQEIRTISLVQKFVDVNNSAMTIEELNLQISLMLELPLEELQARKAAFAALVEQLKELTQQ